MAVEAAMTAGQRILEPAGTVEQHYALGAIDPSVPQCLLERRMSRRRLRADHEPFGTRHLVDRRGNGVVAHSYCEAVALAHRAQDQEIAERLRHTDSGGDG